MSENAARASLQVPLSLFVQLYAEVESPIQSVVRTSGLEVSTEYEFTVRGINNLGEGDFSAPPVSARTTGEARSSADEFLCRVHLTKIVSCRNSICVVFNAMQRWYIARSDPANLGVFVE